MNPAVGIDLGTTNTVVAVQVDRTGPRLLTLEQPSDSRTQYDYLEELKSAVYFEASDSAVIGALASRRLEAIRSIKSKMGTRWRAPHPLNSEIVLSPAYVSGHILKAAGEEIFKQFPEWDRSAILTVPASFNTEQRWDTLAAARMAGLKILRLLDEPTAAFYYFFDQNRHLFDATRPTTALVFDFGGGTLDVTVIRVGWSGHAIEVDPIGRSRYNSLGGDDIDLDLASFLVGYWATTTGTDFLALERPVRAQLGQLFRRAASAYKEEVEHYIAQGAELNEFAIDDEVIVRGDPQRIQLSCAISREQYELLTGRFLSPKNELNIFRPIVQALDVAKSVAPGFDRHEIEMVLYTGGASRMAGVQAALSAYFAPVRCYGISEEDACNTVALGAAACRYDEASKNTGVRVTSRLLEAVVARNEEGTAYVPIVPLTCQPSDHFATEGYRFRTLNQTVSVRLPLFRGKDVHDHDLVPLQDVRFELPRVVPENSEYIIQYRMTSDKTVALRAIFSAEGLTIDSDLDIGSGQASPKRRPQPLMRVNVRP